MSRQTTCILLFILISVSSYLPAQNSFSIEQAVQYAITHHNKIKLDSINIQDATANMKELRAIGMPKLNGSAGYNYFLEVPAFAAPDFITPAVKGILQATGVANDYPDINALQSQSGGKLGFQQKNNLSLSLDASMLVFDGTYIVALRAAKAYQELTQAQAALTPIDLRNTVTEAYHSILIVQQNKEMLLKNIENLKNIRAQTVEIFKNGFNEQLDIDRLDLSISTLKLTVDNLDRSIEIMKDLLKFQMNYPKSESIMLSDSFSNVFNQSFVNQELATAKLNPKNRVEYNLLQKTINLSAMDIERYKMGYLPNAVLIGSFQRQFQSENIFKSGGTWLPTSLVGIQINMPIFDGFEKQAKIQRARLVVEKNKVNLAEMERGFNISVQNAQQQYINAIATVEERQKALNLADNIFKVTNIKYNEGLGTSFELKQAEADVYTAQTNLLQAQYELIKSHFEIEKAIGLYQTQD